MGEEKIIMELTPAEVLMLQKLTEDMEIGYAWMVEIAESIRQKVLAAYEKPHMTREEFNGRVEEVKKLFHGEPAEHFMVKAEKVELQFFYQVEEES